MPKHAEQHSNRREQWSSAYASFASFPAGLARSNSLEYAFQRWTRVSYNLATDRNDHRAPCIRCRKSIDPMTDDLLRLSTPHCLAVSRNGGKAKLGEGENCAGGPLSRRGPVFGGNVFFEFDVFCAKWGQSARIRVRRSRIPPTVPRGPPSLSSWPNEAIRCPRCATGSLQALSAAKIDRRRLAAKTTANRWSIRRGNFTVRFVVGAHAAGGHLSRGRSSSRTMRFALREKPNLQHREASSRSPRTHSPEWDDRTASASHGKN